VSWSPSMTTTYAMAISIAVSWTGCPVGAPSSGPWTGVAAGPDDCGAQGRIARTGSVQYRGRAVRLAYAAHLTRYLVERIRPT
jgi:hypothetical protein